MFETISWQEYITFLSIATGLYYSVVILLFFRKELAGIGKLNNSGPQQPSILPMVHGLLEELKEIVNSNTGRDELIAQLQLRLQKYPAIIGSDFQQSINEYLIRELPQLEGVDIQRLWN